MGFTSIWHWLIVLIIVVVLFGGRGKISSLMGDLGKGLRNFKKGMSNETEFGDGSDPKQINSPTEVGDDSATHDKTTKRS